MARREVETAKWLAFVRRVIRSAGKRVADADEIELRELIELHEELDKAIAEAVRGQRARGVSWAGIAAATGTTRQAAHARWSRAA